MLRNHFLRVILTFLVIGKISAQVVVSNPASVSDISDFTITTDIVAQTDAPYGLNHTLTFTLSTGSFNAFTFPSTLTPSGIITFSLEASDATSVKYRLTSGPGNLTSLSGNVYTLALTNANITGASDTVLISVASADLIGAPIDMQGYLFGSPATLASASAVPEPSTYAVLAGAFSLAVAGSRRKRKAKGQ